MSCFYYFLFTDFYLFFIYFLFINYLFIIIILLMFIYYLHFICGFNINIILWLRANNIAILSRF